MYAAAAITARRVRDPGRRIRRRGRPSGWHSAAEFVGQAAHSRQEAFPVVGFDGELTGVVLASQFEHIPASNWAQLRVDQVAVPVPPAYRAAPDDPAAPVAKRTPLGGEIVAVVLADGRVTGMVTSSDLQKGLHWRALAKTHP